MKPREEDQSFEFWMLAVPDRADNVVKFEEMKKQTNRYCVAFPMNLPDLKMGTLDSLLKALTDLKKLETSVSDVLTRIATSMRDVLELKLEKIQQLLLIGGNTMPQYIYVFRWKENLYPSDQPIEKIQETISGYVEKVSIELSQWLKEYTALKHSKEAMEKSEKGSLMNRDLSLLVKKENFVLGSRHMVTVMVVVRKDNFSDWMNSYELLDDTVIPRSSRLLYQEDDFGLFNVTLFKRNVSSFARKARENRFLVRDFVYDEASIAEHKLTFEQLKTDLEKLRKPLVNFLRGKFGSMYSALVHIWIMRLSVECTLRYGLPAEFTFIFLMAPRVKLKRLRQALGKLYAHLDKAPPPSKEAAEGESTALFEDYYPYVYLKLPVQHASFLR